MGIVVECRTIATPTPPTAKPIDRPTRLAVQGCTGLQYRDCREPVFAGKLSVGIAALPRTGRVLLRLAGGCQVRVEVAMDALVERGFSLGRDERLRIRTGAFTGPTSGLAPGNVQANLVILPRPSPTISCGSPRPTPGRARCWRCPRQAIRFPTWRGSRHPHRPAALPRLAQRRTGRGTHRRRHVWRETWSASPSAARSRSRKRCWRTASRSATSRAAATCRCSAHHPVCAGRRVPRASGGVDATAEAGGCDPCGADHLAVPVSAWRAGTSRLAAADRHPGHRQAGLRRCGAGGCR